MRSSDLTYYWPASEPSPREPPPLMTSCSQPSSKAWIASWSIPISEIETGGIDGAALIVQEGTREKPGIVLGSAFAPIGRQATVGK